MSPFEGRYPFASSISHCQIEGNDPLRFFVVDQEGNYIKLKKFFGFPRARTIINPVIISHGKKKVKQKEGCMSISDKPKRIQRWENVEIEFQTLWTLLFTKRKKKLYLYRAACVQHELDHQDFITSEEVYKNKNFSIELKSSYERP